MRIKAVIIFLIVATFACSPQTVSTATNRLTTVTPFPISPTWAPSPTQPPKPTANVVPAFTVSPEPTIKPKTALGAGWFEITELLPIESITPKAARSFIGVKTPPLPENIILEFNNYDVIGETSPSTIIHQAMVVRQGNARMLWIGVLFWPTDGSSEYTKIYDSIPMPATQPGDMLIAFTCAHNNESDPSLIVIANRGETDLDIQYAWRVDPTSSTLILVAYRDIICWSD